MCHTFIDEADFHKVKLKKNDFITYHLKLQKIINSLNENWFQNNITVRIRDVYGIYI